MLAKGIRNCLTCEFLGDTLFGQDVDALFSYETPKVVTIQDRTLGITSTLLTFVIFLYVVVYEILYKGSHFKEEDVSGIVRLQWQPPTRKCNPFHVDCKYNFTDVTELPYCTQYVGPVQVAPHQQRHCAFKDAWELPMRVPRGVLIPTLIETYEQVSACEPDATNCLRTYAFTEQDGTRQGGTGTARPISAMFVADVEDFTLLIDHSFRTRDGRMEGVDDFTMQGYWEECDERREICETRPILCEHAKCKDHGLATGDDALLQAGARPEEPVHPVIMLNRRLRSQRGAASAGATSAAALAVERGRAQAGQETAGSAEAAWSDAAFDVPWEQGVPTRIERRKQVVSIADGDFVSIATLMEMAGHSLDEEVEDRAGTRSHLHGNATRRMRGGALVVRINYDNYEPWRLRYPKFPPVYTISATLTSAEQYKEVTVIDKGADGRQIQRAYGILFIVEQDGKILYFDLMYALMNLTTALGLMAVANVITDMLALNAMARKDIYKDLKYQFSEDLCTVEPEKDAEKAGGLDVDPPREPGR